MLTDLQCQNARCPEGKKYKRLTDSGGLYLEVTITGAKLWRWKYRFGDKEKRLSLGQYPAVPLATPKNAPAGRGHGEPTPPPVKGARQLRDEARALLLAGTDPGEARAQAKRASLASAETAFEAVARRWWAGWHVNKAPRYAAHLLSRLEADAFPVIGTRPVGTLTAAHLIDMTLRIEKRGAPELARRILQTCGLILRYAVAHGLAERNPVADVRPGDFLKPRLTKNFARIGADELPELLRKMEAYEGSVLTRMALRLMALTFVRTSELIGARWQEFDLAAAVWTVPPEREGRKGAAGKRRPHIVPLAPQALEALGILQAARGADRCTGPALLFPGERDHEKPMSGMTILMALRRLGYGQRMTGHGFRGVASTALNEMGFRADVIEAQLSHVDGSKVRAAYNHAQWLPERREMMTAWADYLDAVRSGGKVIPFRQAAGKVAA
jgi:integrase